MIERNRTETPPTYLHGYRIFALLDFPELLALEDIMDDRVDTMQTVTWNVAGWSAGAPSPTGLDWQIADHGLPEDEADLDFYARQDRWPAW